MDLISRVAVVEDDPEIARMMTECMTDHDFRSPPPAAGVTLIGSCPAPRSIA